MGHSQARRGSGRTPLRARSGGRTNPEPSKLVPPPPGSHVMQDYATRSGKARVTAAVRLETFSLP